MYRIKKNLKDLRLFKIRFSSTVLRGEKQNINPQWIKGNASYCSVAYLWRNAYGATWSSKFFLNISAFCYTEYYSHDPTNTYRGILILTGSDTKSGSIDFKKKLTTSKW